MQAQNEEGPVTLPIGIENRRHYVYGLHPAGFEHLPPVYVGATYDPYTRKQVHESSRRIRLHFSIICECDSRQEAREIETRCIRALIRAGVKIANKTVGDGYKRPGARLYESLSLVALAKENEALGVSTPEWDLP
jgi:hypothetical protein